jgi:hypothetical protein
VCDSPESVSHLYCGFFFAGNLYYALTHAPGPLTKEDAYALSWKAATERLEAAGSIPVKEAEMMSEALKSNDTSIEVRTDEPFSGRFCP